MALFGFGKKKEPAPAPKPEPKPVEIKGKPDQQFVIVDGQWYANPNYDPNAANEAKKDGPAITSFWTESVDNFLARNDNAKLVKLTGKQEDLSFYSVGSRCKVEQDIDDPDKYNVTCDGSVIGRLPAAGITYAEKYDMDPVDLAVIVAEVDYDMEKDRDIISVYISD